MYRTMNTKDDSPKFIHKLLYKLRWPILLVTPFLRVAWILFFPVWYIVYPIAIVLAPLCGWVLLGNHSVFLCRHVSPSCRDYSSCTETDNPFCCNAGIKGVRPYVAWWSSKEYDYKQP